MAFYNDLAIGKKGEQYLTNQLSSIGYQVHDVTQERQYQAQDIDLIAIKDNVNATIEVKNDRGIFNYGNVFLELISNLEYGTAGWFTYCRADYLVFYEEQRGIAHLVKRAELVDTYNRNKNSIKVRQCGTETKGACMPLAMLRALPSYRQIGYTWEQLTDDSYFMDKNPIH